jgi:YVTN family beta-propeller protein
MLRKTWRVGALTLLVLGTAWGSLAHGDPLPVRAAYVTNRGDDTVSVISLDTRQVIATIGVGDNPQSVVVTPNGLRAYVTNAGSNSVSVIDTTSGSVIDTITAAQGIGVYPTGLAVSRDGSRVYVVNHDSPSLSVIDTTTNTVVNTVATPPMPGAIAFHPVRDEVWLGFETIPTVFEVRSAADLSVLASATSTEHAYASGDLAFRADGSEAFGAEVCGECGRFYRISGTHSGGSISILQSDILWYDPPGAATSVAIHPTTGVAYLGKADSSLNSYQSPKIFEFANGAVGRTLTFTGRDYTPRSMEIAPDDGLLYVVQGWDAQGFLSIIDPTNLSTIATVNVGRAPLGIALTVPEPSAWVLLAAFAGSSLLVLLLRRRPGTCPDLSS